MTNLLGTLKSLKLRPDSGNINMDIVIWLSDCHCIVVMALLNSIEATVGASQETVKGAASRGRLQAKYVKVEAS